MRIKMITLAVTSMLATSALATTTGAAKYLEEQQTISFIKQTQALDETIKEIETVLFVQPSYFATHGEYEAYRRIWAWLESTNATYGHHDGLGDYKVVVKDIVPMMSIPDTLPYLSEYDDDGNEIATGAQGMLAQVVLGGTHPEHDIYNTWQPDLVTYLREQRGDEFLNGKLILGLAGIGGMLNSILDNNTDRAGNTTWAHEVGHNIGLNHEEEEAFVGPDYARAWKCDGQRTIMYSGGGHTHYSDPNVMRGGEACGDVDVADNARVLRENIPSVVMRGNGVASLGTVSFADTAYQALDNGNLAITLVRDGDLTAQASVKVFTENGTAQYGVEFVDTHLLATFDAGMATATVELPIINHSDEAKTLDLLLKYPYALTVDDVDTLTATINAPTTAPDAGEFSLSGVSEVIEG